MGVSAGDAEWFFLNVCLCSCARECLQRAGEVVLELQLRAVVSCPLWVRSPKPTKPFLQLLSLHLYSFS